jgi:hypothetical protein
MKNFLNVKALFFLILIIFSFVSFAQNEGEEIETVKVKDTIELGTDGIKIIIPETANDSSIIELGEILKEMTDDIGGVVSNGEFPPKTTAAWIALILGLLPIINKFIVSGTKTVSLVKNLFGGVKTNTIVWSSALIIGTLFSLFNNDWNVFSLDWGKWTAAVLATAVVSMAFHELIEKVKRYLNRNKETEIA